MIERFDHPVASGFVRELRLARPPANALSAELIALLRSGVEGAGPAGASALVLSGSPGMFTGGLDVPALLPLDRVGIERAWADFYAVLWAIASSPIPVVAAITGHSPAGGAVLAMICDLRVMAEGRYRIGLNEVAVGIPIPLSFLRSVERLVGTHRAARMLAEAQLLDASEAWRIGFVDELAPLDGVVERAIGWCRTVLALPERAYRETRALTRRGLVEIFAASEREVPTLVDQWFRDETQRAMHALVERLAARRATP